MGKENYPQLQNIDFADSCHVASAMQIDLLIDSDYIWNCFDGKAILAGEGVRSSWSRCCLNESGLLSGTVVNLPQERLSIIQFSSTRVLKIDSRKPEVTLPMEMQRLWDPNLDSVGIRDGYIVHEAFEKNLGFAEGQFVVHVPWKEHYKLLPDYFENSVARPKPVNADTVFLIFMIAFYICSSKKYFVL